MSILDMLMFSWQVLRDEYFVNHNRITPDEERALEGTMDYLARRYMEKATSALRGGGWPDGADVQEFASEIVRQRIIDFNAPLRQENRRAPEQ